MNNVDISGSIIEGFNINNSEYALLERENIAIKGDATNRVFSKEAPSNIDVSINFIDSKSSVVFLGKNLKGSVRITIKGSDSLVYIGNDCTLKKLVIDSNQASDFIAIGNHVTTNFDCAFRSGLRATQHAVDDYLSSPGIIIGDDCMFAANCLIRSSDAHPILEYPSLKHLNKSYKPVVLEEHIWIAANASILKNVTVGANSVIASAAVVTKDVPKYSIVKGNPMKISSSRGKIWQRAFTKRSESMAIRYYKKYEHILDDMRPESSKNTEKL